MHTQAVNSASKSVLFTSLWGFLRVAAADSEHLYLSDNIMVHTGDNDEPRRSIDTNEIIMQELFFFLFAAVVKAYGSEVMLPPDFQNLYQNPSYTEIITPPAQPFSLPRFFTKLSSSIGRWLLQKKAWVWQLAFRVFGGKLIKYVSDFEVLSIEGVFKRHNERKVFFLKKKWLLLTSFQRLVFSSVYSIYIGREQGWTCSGHKQGAGPCY